MNEFHFLRPLWLLLLFLLMVLIWFLTRQKLKAGNWAAHCDDKLLPYILIDKSSRQNRWPLLAFSITGLLAIIALAGPTWQQLPSPVFRNESALVLVLDLSRSMNATDIKPSRLERARYKIEDILQQTKDGQFALIVYASDAFTVTPLTNDTDTIRTQLAALNTSIMPSQGSRPSLALSQAEALLKQAGLAEGVILLITDSVNLSAIEKPVQRLKSKGYKLSVLGIGTEDGAPIPMRQGGFLKDSKGAIVIPRLKPAILQQLATMGGGIYRTLTSNNRDIEALLTEFDQQAMSALDQENDLKINQWREEGPWLLLPILPLVAFAFRRGYIALLLICIFQLPRPVYALEWEELWTTPDQQAHKAYQQGEINKAAQIFQNPEWKAASEYSSGQFEQSVQTLTEIETSDSYYNKGNALARLGRYADAIKAYQQALELDSNNEDATYNKNLVEKELEKQSQQQNQESENSQSDDKNSENSDSQNSASDQEMNDQNKHENQESSDSEPEEGQATTSEDQSTEPEDQNANKLDEKEQYDSENPDNQHAYQERTTEDESAQANEQWLRRIPDDPGELLRRKFRYQYKQRKHQSKDRVETW